MSDKEATVYIVDVGRSMGQKHHGRDESDLDWAMKYIWDKIATTVGTGRKTLLGSVIAARTDETDNDLAEDSSYENISVLLPLGQMTMSTIRTLMKQIKPSKTENGDVLSAIVLAIQSIWTVCKVLKYKRRIVLVTNGRGTIDEDGIPDIVEKANELDIELTVLGVDFGDPEYGFKEESKDPVKAKNEDLLEKLTGQCKEDNGIFGTLKQAIDELGIPRLKSTRPIASYKGMLSLGDAENYETAMSINVERYPYTMIQRAPGASNFVVRSDMAPEPAVAGPSTAPQAGANGDADGNLSTIHNARTYQVKDEEAPGGKRDLAREDLAKGYEYGRTAVHIAESDENVTKLETTASLGIVGFIPAANHEHYMNMLRSHVIVPLRINEKAVIAMSSFVHALYELESYAVARLVVKDGKDPELVLLVPSIEPHYECLFEVELPFAEDMRSYKFPPLDRIVTISGKIIKEHRNLPNQALKDAMDDFVDQMDISTFEKDDDGNPTEYAALGNTYSPMLHRLKQVIQHRAVHPDGSVPPPYEILTKYMHPPDELMERAMPYVEKVREAADVKKVPPKSLSKGKRFARRKEEKPRSNLDVAALLSARTKESNYTISPTNAIPEFKQVLSDVTDIAVVASAVAQFGSIITDMIRFSLGDQKYDQAIEAIDVMRSECVELEEPGLYNEWLRGLKGRLLEEGGAGGDRREMWWKVKKARLGLIDKRTSEVSDVSEEDAQAFLTTK